MISEPLLVPIITGGCVILSACMERVMTIICPEIRRSIANICFKYENEESPPPPPYIINSPATLSLIHI